MTGTIDFIKGGIESSPNFSLEAEVKFLASALNLPHPKKAIRTGYLHATRVAGDIVESATEPLRKAYQAAEVVREYFSSMSQTN